MEKRKTIVDVAEADQVSTGSVHRALYGKPGVSEELRKKLLKSHGKWDIKPIRWHRH